MIYFSFSQILISIFASVALGIISGGIYKSISLIFSLLFYIIKILPTALCADSYKKHTSPFSNHKTSTSCINRTISDFIFFTLLFSLYICLIFITMDGVFRLYIMAFMLIGFFTSKRTLGWIFEKILVFLFNFFYNIIFSIMYILFFPINLTFKKIRTILIYRLEILKRKLIMHKSKVTSQKKAKEIQAYFKRITALK